MNRKQAEDILDAYIEIYNTYKRGTRTSASVDKALESMREVILDAMTTTYYSPITVRPETVKPWWGSNGITLTTTEVDDGR